MVKALDTMTCLGQPEVPVGGLDSSKWLVVQLRGSIGRVSSRRNVEDRRVLDRLPAIQMVKAVWVLLDAVLRNRCSKFPCHYNNWVRGAVKTLIAADSGWNRLLPD